MDKPNPGLTALFVDAFRQQTEPQKEVTSEKTEERDPEVVAWENDEITSIEVKTVEVKSPFAPLPEEAGDYLEKECGVTIHRQPLTCEIYGKEFFLAHGDGLGAFRPRQDL